MKKPLQVPMRRPSTSDDPKFGKTTRRIELMGLSKILPAKKNVKAHDVGAINDSLSRFGYVEAIALDERTERLIAGHGRVDTLKAMRKDKQKPPPGVEVAGDGEWLIPVQRGWASADDDEAIAYLIASNRTPELGGWDQAALNPMLIRLAKAGADALKGTGFDRDDVDRILTEARKNKGQTDPDDVPVLPLKPWVKTGDLFQCGDHRLLCGDSTSVDDVARLMVGKEIDAFFTSPPYNVGVDYKNGESDTLDPVAYANFVGKIASTWSTHLGQGRPFIWNIGVTPNTQPFEQGKRIEAAGLLFHRQFIWKKVGVPIPMWYHTQRDPRARYCSSNRVHEVVWVFSKGELEVGAAVALVDELEHDVFSVQQTLASVDLPAGDHLVGSGIVNLERRHKKAHPAPFPVKLPQLFLGAYAATGERVADPFMGSGTTMIAAETLGRAAYGMELEPRFVQLAVERWEKFTGEKATKL